MKLTRSDFEFCHRLRVRYSEIDGQHIVFNAHYLTYIDITITEFFRQRGFDYQGFVEEEKIDFIVRRSTIDYLIAARFDDEIDICVKGQLVKTKILWQVAMFRGDELLCTAELVYAIIETNSGRPSKRGSIVAEQLKI